MAGVSVLALAAPAAGEVVVTKKTIHVPLATDGTLEPIKISMANNGIDNFQFTFSSTSLGVYRFLLAGAPAGTFSGTAKPSFADVPQMATQQWFKYPYHIHRILADTLPAYSEFEVIGYYAKSLILQNFWLLWMIE